MIEPTKMQKRVLDYSGGRLFINASRCAGKTEAIKALINQWIDGKGKCFNDKQVYNVLVVCNPCVQKDIISGLNIEKSKNCKYNVQERCINIFFNTGKNVNIKFISDFNREHCDILIVDDLLDEINPEENDEIINGKSVISYFFSKDAEYIIFGTPDTGNKIVNILYYAAYNYAKKNGFLINADLDERFEKYSYLDEFRERLDKNMFEAQFKHNVEAMFW